MKTAIISQARMTSTRLPGKVLMRIKDKPLLAYHIERLKQSGLPVYIAMTTNAADDPIEALCREMEIPFYRGDEHHVLSRFYECAVDNHLDLIVRVTSDCPLIDGHEIRAAVDKWISEGHPRTYMSNTLSRSYPRGFDFEIFSFELLQEAMERASTEAEKEHVTPYFYADPKPDIALKSITWPSDKSAYRITVDTADDFDLIRELIEAFRAENLSAMEIAAILDAHPELVAINQHIAQKKL